MGSSYQSLCDAIFEALPCEIIVHDEGTVLLANAAACRLFAAPSPRSLVGLPLSAMVHPDTRAAGERRRAQLFGDGKVFDRLSVRLTTLAGDEVFAEVTGLGFSVGERTYALVVNAGGCPTYSHRVPLNDRHSPAETPLAQAALDALPLCLTAYDSEDRIIYANRAALQLFRPGSDGLEGQSVSVVIHPHSSEASRERRRLVLDYGQCFHGIEAKVRNVAGDPVRISGSLGRAKTPDGSHVGYWLGYPLDDTPAPECSGQLPVD